MQKIHLSPPNTSSHMPKQAESPTALSNIKFTVCAISNCNEGLSVTMNRKNPPANVSDVFFMCHFKLLTGFPPRQH